MVESSFDVKKNESEFYYGYPEKKYRIFQDYEDEVKTSLYVEDIYKDFELTPLYDENVKFSRNIIKMILEKYKLVSVGKFILIEDNTDKKFQEEMTSSSLINFEEIIFYTSAKKSKFKLVYTVFTTQGILFTDENAFLGYQDIENFSCNPDKSKISVNEFSIKLHNSIPTNEILNIIGEFKLLKKKCDVLENNHPMLLENIETRKLYLNFLANLMTSDEKIYASEINNLYMLFKYLEVGDKYFIEIINKSFPFILDNVEELNNELENIFYKTTIKFSFIKDLIDLAFADEKYALIETMLIENAAKNLVIDTDIIDTMIKLERVKINSYGTEDTFEDLISKLENQLKQYNPQVKKILIPQNEK